MYPLIVYINKSHYFSIMNSLHLFKSYFGTDTLYVYGIVNQMITVDL